MRVRIYHLHATYLKLPAPTCYVQSNVRSQQPGNDNAKVNVKTTQNKFDNEETPNMKYVKKELKSSCVKYTIPRIDHSSCYLLNIKG